MSDELENDEKQPKAYSKDFLLKFKNLNTDKPDDLPTMDELLRGNSAPLERPPPSGGKGNDGRGGRGGNEWQRGQVQREHSGGKGGRQQSGGRPQSGGRQGGAAGSGTGYADIPMGPPIKFGRGKVTNSKDDGKKVLQEVRSVLNKLTPEKFDRLSEQLIQAATKSLEVRDDTVDVFKGMVALVFEKAINEPSFSSMYADLSKRLAERFPECPGGLENGKKVTFKRVLLNLCHDEFHSLEHAEVKDDQYEREQNEKNRRLRMKGNVKFIGELYKQALLSTSIMRECIDMLLGEPETDAPLNELYLEGLSTLLATIGHSIDKEDENKKFMDRTFQQLILIAKGQNAGPTKLAPRERFMLQDVCELRANQWQPRQKVTGPATIDAIRKQAEKEMPNYVQQPQQQQQRR